MSPVTTTGGVPRTAFPATWYRGRGDAFTGTVRYFVDKAPMSVGADGVLTIAYVQGVEESLAGFRAFLDRYARLCSALPRVHIVWVVPHLGRFARAQATMTAWGRRTAGLSSLAPTILRRELTAYCEARRRLETGLRASLVRDLRLVRERHQRVVGPRFPGLYAQWRERGTLAIDTCVAQERPPDVSRVDLRAVAFPYRHGLFGTAFGVTPPRCHVARSPRRTRGDVAA